MPDTFITVHFATNREETGDPKTPFGDKLNRISPGFLRYGSADVIPPTTADGEFRVQDVHIAPDVTPGANAADDAAAVRGSELIYAGLRRRLAENDADLLLFLHGFNCSFGTALARAAQLKQNWSTATKKLEVAAFSWPADRSLVPVLGYFSDRDDARSSAKAIARALLRLVDYIRTLPPAERCNRKLHLAAHSMGNYALRNAFQALLSELGGKVPRLFDTIFLMAADEDNDAFELDTKMLRLPDLARQVYVYYSGLDGALVISDVTKANPDRLGFTGPRTLTNLPQKVTLVDCAAVCSSTLLEVNHQYYRQRPEVLADVQQVLAGVAPDQIGNRKYIPDKRAFRIGAAKAGGG